MHLPENAKAAFLDKSVYEKKYRGRNEILWKIDILEKSCKLKFKQQQFLKCNFYVYIRATFQ